MQEVGEMLTEREAEHKYVSCLFPYVLISGNWLSR